MDAVDLGILILLALYVGFAVGIDVGAVRERRNWRERDE